MNFTEQSTCVIVGGYTGIGRALADALRERPGRVLVASRRSGLDVTDPSAVERYFEAIGTIDHLIFTAGSQAPGGQLLDMDLSTARAAFDTKFWGSLAVAKVGARYLRAGGSLTLTSGFLARRAVPGTFVKTAMNAALEAVAKVLARELAPDILVNAIAPGPVDTDMTSIEHMSEEALAKDLNSPLARFGSPHDIAAMAAFLAGPQAGFITGQCFGVNGGSVMP